MKRKLNFLLYILILLCITAAIAFFINHRIDRERQGAVEEYIRAQEELNSSSIIIEQEEMEKLLINLDTQSKRITELYNAIWEYQEALREAQETIADQETIINSINTTASSSIALIDAREAYLRKKYPTQYKIWCFLIDNNISEVAAAGILGNIESESGFQPGAINKKLGAYGLCQWLQKYSPEVYGKDIDYQLDFLVNTITKAFNDYGYLYKKSYNFEAFNKSASEKDSAAAFAAVYERPGSSDYTQRKTNATKWYELFAYTYNKMN